MSCWNYYTKTSGDCTSVCVKLCGIYAGEAENLGGAQGSDLTS